MHKLQHVKCGLKLQNLEMMWSMKTGGGRRLAGGMMVMQIFR